MKNNIGRLASTLFSIAFIVIVIGSVVIVAQTPITGEWKADTRSDKLEKGDRIQLNFERRTEKGGRNSNGSSYSFDDFQGLSREQTQNGNVRFSLVREAGTIECQGTFVNGKGSGTFTFTPNRSFVDAMKSRGFDFDKMQSKGDSDSEERLFAAATLNVTTKLADDLLSANFGKLDIDNLFEAAIFKVDGKFMAEMKASGFPNLKMQNLVEARIFKIDADYVKQVSDMGFEEKGFQGLVEFKIFKVTPEFLAELKSQGFTNLRSQDVVNLRVFNIDSEFIRKAKTENPNVTIEDLVQMKIGVGRHKGTN